LLRNIPKIGLVFFGAFALLPFFTDSPYILGVITMASLYAVWAMSWDIFSGYTGEINFGYAFFIGTAAFVGAIFGTRLGLTPWLSIAIGALTAMLLAFILGILTLRLRGPYFTIITMAINIAFSELALVLWKWTGGEEGIAGIEPLTDGPASDYYVTLIFSFVVFVVLVILSRSKHGHILIAIRENEDAAEASGINTIIYRVLMFGLSAFIAGIGGGLHIHIQMHASHDLLSLSLSTMILIMAIFGGMGTIIGPMFGAYCLSILSELLRNLAEYRMLIYTGILVLTIFYAPNGIFLRMKTLFSAILSKRKG